MTKTKRRSIRSSYRDEGWVASLMDAPVWVIVVVLSVVSIVVVIAFAAASFFVPAIRWTNAWFPLLAMFIAVAAGLWVALGERAVRRRRLAFAADLHRLGALSPHEFEDAVSELFRIEGWVVTENRHPDDEDGGVDLELVRDGQRLFAQVKHKWDVVGVRDIRELAGVVSAEGAAGGVFVTSSRFTAAADDFARQARVRLIDGPAFLQLRGDLLAGARDEVAERDPVVSEGFARHLTTVPRPACPKCGKPMVVVTTLAGARVRNQFWGCADYPDCQSSRRFSSPYVGDGLQSTSGFSATLHDRVAILRSNAANVSKPTPGMGE